MPGRIMLARVYVNRLQIKYLTIKTYFRQKEIVLSAYSDIQKYPDYFVNLFCYIVIEIS